MLNAEDREQLIDNALAPSRIRLVGLKRKQQVLFDGERAKDGGLLRQVAQTQSRPLVYWVIRNIEAFKNDASRIRLEDAYEELKDRTLAGAGGAKQRHNFRPMQMNAHVLDD